MLVSTDFEAFNPNSSCSSVFIVWYGSTWSTSFFVLSFLIDFYSTVTFLELSVISINLIAFWCFLVDGGRLNLHLMAAKGEVLSDSVGDWIMVLFRVSCFNLPPNWKLRWFLGLVFLPLLLLLSERELVLHCPMMVLRLIS